MGSSGVFHQKCTIIIVTGLLQDRLASQARVLVPGRVTSICGAVRIHSPSTYLTYLPSNLRTSEPGAVTMFVQ